MTQQALETWTDHLGRVWPVIASSRRLKFKTPLHAAIRVFVYHRDGFKCVRCGCRAVGDTAAYDGRYTLETERVLANGFRDLLVIDHVLTLLAGGRNVVENFQTLCESCNRAKMREDRAATLAHRQRGAA